MIRIDRHGYGRFTVPLSGTNFGLLLDHDHSDRVMLMGLPARSGWRAISSVCLSHQTYVKKAEEWLEGNKHARKIAVLEVDSGEWQTVWEGGWTDGVKADWLPKHGVGCVECRRPVPSGVVSHEPCSHCDDAADGLRADGGPEQTDNEHLDDGRWCLKTEIQHEDDEFRVSTVELPIGHGPEHDQTHETCVFWGNGESWVLERYTDQESAAEGHERVLREIRSGNYRIQERQMASFELTGDDGMEEP